LGGHLAGLRRERGLTGEALGALVGFSQAKISKIERGMLRPSPNDVELMAKALQASPGAVAGLVELAVKLNTPSQPRRTQPRRGGEGQHDFAVYEPRATKLKIFECTVVPSLLQISEYTRRVVNGYFELTTDDVELKWAEIAATVSQRAKRQEQLYNPDKVFDFVVLETVLLHRYTTPGDMLAQVERIESVAELANITVRLVPAEAQLGYPPLHGFTVLDDDVVLIEIGGEAGILRDPEDVGFYRRLFDHYSDRGTSELGPLLDKYKSLYADLARPR
jgi:transcriptional regulator with XRE-family HTH domain